MNKVGQAPWYPEYTNVLALDADRPEPQEYQWHRGSLGSCRTSIGPAGVPEIEVETSSDDVSVRLLSRRSGIPGSGLVVATRSGSVTDFGMGTRTRGSLPATGRSLAAGIVPKR